MTRAEQQSTSPRAPSFIRHARLYRASSKLGVMVLCGLAGLSCKHKTVEPVDVPVAASADRLSPQETLPNEEIVFGIPVPHTLKVVQRFPDSVYLVGRAKMDDLSNYFRQYVEVKDIEIGGKHNVFPSVYIKGDTSKRIYRIEITALTPTRSSVKIKDITPPPFVPNLTEAQRWEQAGLNPDGTIKDRLKVY